MVADKILSCRDGRSRCTRRIFHLIIGKKCTKLLCVFSVKNNRRIEIERFSCKYFILRSNRNITPLRKFDNFKSVKIHIFFDFVPALLNKLNFSHDCLIDSHQFLPLGSDGGRPLLQSFQRYIRFSRILKFTDCPHRITKLTHITNRSQLINLIETVFAVTIAGISVARFKHTDFVIIMKRLYIQSKQGSQFMNIQIFF